MTAKFTVLGNTTLATSSASVTFSSIPSGYKDLVLVVDATTATTWAAVYFQVNNDTGNNYSMVRMSGDGSGATSGTATNTGQFFGYGNDSYIGTAEGYLMTSEFSDYSATDKHKTVLTRVNNAARPAVDAMAQRWASTSAITSIRVYLSNDSYAAGSTFRLLGVN